MPFTIGGEWIPNTLSQKKQPLKIVKEKRRSSYVTLILNLSYDKDELKKLCSALKQRLGCGGSIKQDQIELQGDQVEPVKIYLKELKMK